MSIPTQIQTVEVILNTFAEAPNFAEVMQLSFGQSAETLQTAWLSNDFEIIPSVEILEGSLLNGATGGYAQATNTIYLSQDFVDGTISEVLTAVLLEEIGHAIDAQINETDSPGDEGAIFSSLVREESLSNAQLDSLRAEDDRAVFILNGEAITVEQSTFTTLVVNTEADEADGSVVDGDVSLRDAISAITPRGTITLANGINTITLDETLGELVINKGLTIDGDFDDDGSPDVTVERASDATAEFRIFNIDDGDYANAVTVTLDGLTITGGVASGSFIDSRGGGIYNREDLTLTNSAVSGNSANDGGGIFNYYGTASITNSTVSGNSANNGGGIYNRGTANVTNSTVSGNSGAGFSGGIFNLRTASITNSTVSGNSANDGGGIFNFGTATLSNSLISGNSAATSGNEVFNYIGSFLTATINADANNLFGDDSQDNSQAFTNFTPGVNDITATSDGTNPTALNSILDPAGLQNNGGVTETIALVPNSPAIDAGNNTLIPAGVDFDQRGDGFDRIVNGTVDIGALEVQASPAPTELIVDTETDEADGSVVDGDISLRDALAAIAPGGTITFANGINTITLDETLGELLINKGLTLDGDFDDDGSPDVTVERASDATVDFRIFNIDDGDYANAVTVTLDGLTITGGVASGSFIDSRGGGIYNREDLTLTNSAVSGNSANDGGGIFNYYGTASITNSTVSGNSAAGFGGGIYNDGTAHVTNSIVSSNSAFAGGGIYNDITAKVTGSIISSNSAQFGGGVFNYGTAYVTNSTISGNSAGAGGGISNNIGDTNVTNSTVSGNSATFGGGIYNNIGNTNVSHSTISGNSADSNGGGIFNFGTATLSNSLISGNVSTNQDDEIFLGSGTIYADANNLFGNSNQTNAEAFSNFTPGGNDITATSDGTNTALSDILDPAGLADNGGVTQTIALSPNSPAIDAGDNSLIPAGVDFDQRGDGFDRIVNGTVDIGAFEAPLPPPTDLIVDTETDEADGSVVDGDVSLRDALAAIAPGGTITFADGINTITLDETLGELVIDKGLTIDGDFDDDGIPDVTVERASDATVDFRILNIDDGDNANAVTVTLDGLTITGGVASGSFPNDRGGGISNREDLTLINSTVSGNSANNVGGGIYNYYGTATLSNSTLTGNSADFGGGIYNYGTASITNSTVTGNSANFLGGGIYNRGTASITNSTVSGNSADYGGGIYNDGTASITNSTVSGNSADYGGGIYNGFFDTASLSNSLISGNSAATSGNEVFNNSNSFSIINADANNLFGDDSQDDSQAFTNFTPGVNDINATSDGTNTALSDILDPAGLADNGGVTETIALVANSPAIDAGDNALIPAGVSFDQRGIGFDRIVNGTVDIGAFEVQGESAPLVNGIPATGSVDSDGILQGGLEGAGDPYNGELFSNTDGTANPNDVIAGTSGDDQIWAGTSGDDLIDGGAGNDEIGIGTGNATVFGGDGDDFVYSIEGGGGTNVIDLGEGNNGTWFESGDYIITAGSGDDSIGLGDGTEDVDVGDGDNIIYMVNPDGSNDGDKDILTGTGSDWAQTGSGDDIINLGTNNGFDIAFGQGGNDTFVLNLGDGWLSVEDFTQGEDILAGIAFAELTPITDTARNSTWLRETDSNELVAELKDFTGTLTEADFSL